MKTVMSGVALAAILALAIPAWAAAPGDQGSQAKSVPASMSHAKKTHAARGMHTRKMAHKNMRHNAMRYRAGHHHAAQTRPIHRTTTAGSPTDNVANQLNRAEAQRLSGSSMPPMGNPNMGPMGNPNMAPMGNPNPQ